MNTNNVLRQQEWSEDDLRVANMAYYPPRKLRIMARVLEIPLEIHMTIEILSAKTGDIVIYDPGDGTRKDSINDYEHWPVRNDLFRKTYKLWDEPAWQPNDTELHLITHGCRPYYKHTGVWAKRLTESVWIQSLESVQPVEVTPGRWLIIGIEGEPFHTSDSRFRERYIVESSSAI